ncbi:type I methionyl aminopeptidase [Candidatus Nomurabacteria bacterium]|nr:MAG: type I methionyl aminopeptidase [Candidatus Nomurabacteria bacterium]
MVIIKTDKEIAILREGGKRLAWILDMVAKKIVPGITTGELDSYAKLLIHEGGDTAAFLGYTPDGANYPYPAALCTSINDEVVHGIPTNRKLKKGDIVSIDLGLKHDGMFTDHARTIAVGKPTKQLQKLLSTTEEALMIGIQAARGGSTVGDVGAAIEAYVKPYGYGIVRELAGHGVGRAIHEDPYVPNFGKAGKGERLVPGMVIAIEPMLNLGSKEVVFEDDGYTVKTRDGKQSAHFEHTILITKGEPEILTSLN